MATRAQRLDPKAAKTLLLEKSITSATLKQYATKIATLRLFLQHLTADGETPPLTLEGFASFLVEYTTETGTHHVSTAEGYRSAILFHQRVYDLWLSPDGTQWAASPEAKKIVSGFGYNAKHTEDKSPVRGQVDHDLFKELVEYTTLHNIKLLVAILLAYKVALRIHELISLHKGAYDPVTHSLAIPDKRANAANQRPTHTKKPVIDHEAQQLLADLEYIRSPGEEYFPKSLFTEKEFRLFFHQAVAALQWHTRFPGLIFDGPHTLRHGGMLHVDTLLSATDMDEQVKLDTMQVSHDTHKRYTKTNDMRRKV
jgi:integrase